MSTGLAVFLGILIFLIFCVGVPLLLAATIGGPVTLLLSVLSGIVGGALLGALLTDFL